MKKSFKKIISTILLIAMLIPSLSTNAFAVSIDTIIGRETEKFEERNKDIRSKYFEELQDATKLLMKGDDDLNGVEIDDGEIEENKGEVFGDNFYDGYNWDGAWANPDESKVSFYRKLPSEIISREGKNKLVIRPRLLGFNLVYDLGLGLGTSGPINRLNVIYHNDDDFYYYRENADVTIYYESDIRMEGQFNCWPGGRADGPLYTIDPVKAFWVRAFIKYNKEHNYSDVYFVGDRDYMAYYNGYDRYSITWDLSENVGHVNWNEGEDVTWTNDYSKFSSYTTGKERALPTKDDIKKDNYSLAGWYINDDRNKVYTSIPDTQKGDITLTPKWNKRVKIPTGLIVRQDGYNTAPKAHVIKPKRAWNFYDILGLNKNEINSINLGWGPDHRPKDAYDIIDYYSDLQAEGSWSGLGRTETKLDPVEANGVNAALLYTETSKKYDVYLFGMYALWDLDGRSYGIYWDLSDIKEEIKQDIGIDIIKHNKIYGQVTWVEGEGATWTNANAKFDQYEIGEKQELPTNDDIKKDNYKLNGWFLNNEKSTSHTSISAAQTGNITLTANWTKYLKIPKELIYKADGFNTAPKAHVIKPKQAKDFYSVLGLNKEEINSINLGWASDHRPKSAYELIDYYSDLEVEGSWTGRGRTETKLDPVDANGVNAALLYNEESKKYDVYLFGMYALWSLNGRSYGIYWDLSDVKEEIKADTGIDITKHYGQVTWVVGDNATWKNENAKFDDYEQGTEHALPTKDDIFRVGYEFDGWFINDDKNTKYTSIPATQTGNITLTANWAEKYVNIPKEMIGNINSEAIHIQLDSKNWKSQLGLDELGKIVKVTDESFSTKDLTKLGTIKYQSTDYRTRQATTDIARVIAKAWALREDEIRATDGSSKINLSNSTIYGEDYDFVKNLGFYAAVYVDSNKGEYYVKLNQRKLIKAPGSWQYYRSVFDNVSDSERKFISKDVYLKWNFGSVDLSEQPTTSEEESTTEETTTKEESTTKEETTASSSDATEESTKIEDATSKADESSKESSSDESSKESSKEGEQSSEQESTSQTVAEEETTSEEETTKDSGNKKTATDSETDESTTESINEGGNTQGGGVAPQEDTDIVKWSIQWDWTLPVTWNFTKEYKANNNIDYYVYGIDYTLPTKSNIEVFTDDYEFSSWTIIDSDGNETTNATKITSGTSGLITARPIFNHIEVEHITYNLPNTWYERFGFSENKENIKEIHFVDNLDDITNIKEQKVIDDTTPTTDPTVAPTQASSEEAPTEASTTVTEGAKDVGQQVQFGSYNGTPLNWIVLDKTADKALLLFDYNEDKTSLTQRFPYYYAAGGGTGATKDNGFGTTWATCWERQILNQTEKNVKFLSRKGDTDSNFDNFTSWYVDLFTEEEKKKILTTKVETADYILPINNNINNKGGRLNNNLQFYVLDENKEYVIPGGETVYDKLFNLSWEELNKYIEVICRKEIFEHTKPYPGSYYYFQLRTPSVGDTIPREPSTSYYGLYDDYFLNVVTYIDGIKVFYINTTSIMTGAAKINHCPAMWVDISVVNGKSTLMAPKSNDSEVYAFTGTETTTTETVNKTYAKAIITNDNVLYVAPGENVDLTIDGNASNFFGHTYKGKFTNATVIDGLDKLDFSNTTNMHNFFAYCEKLKSVDVSSLNTSKVTDMSQMFFDCKAITSLDLSTLDTKKVENMTEMFKNMSSLITIYVSKYDMDKSALTNSKDMFINDTKLVGGEGTAYDANIVDKTYANIDRKRTNGTKGYFTVVGEGGGTTPETPVDDGSYDIIWKLNDATFKDEYKYLETAKHTTTEDFALPGEEALNVPYAKLFKYWTVDGVATTSISKNIKKAVTVTANIVRASYNYETYSIGSYKQDGEEATNIEWVVLDKKDGKLLLTTKHIIDTKSYDTNDSANFNQSSIRRWLNNEFYKNAFTKEQQEKLLDVTFGGNEKAKVFMLNAVEINEYYPEAMDRVTKATNYALDVVNNGETLETKSGNIGQYWLMTTSSGNLAPYVTFTGEINEVGARANSNNIGVRPCIWVSEKEIKEIRVLDLDKIFTLGKDALEVFYDCWELFFGKGESKGKKK